MKKIIMAFCITLTSQLPLAKIHIVEVSSNIFTPPNLVIEAGDTVRWINNGTGSHNVRASDGSFRCAEGCDAEGGNGDPSNAFWEVEVTFRKVGTVPYICEPHIGFGMQGSIIVIAPQSVAVHEVHASGNNSFDPDDLTIMRGDIIRFIKDSGVHNIHADDDSLICSQGCVGDGTDTISNASGFPWDIYVRFNNIEEIPYFCEEHNNVNDGTGIIRVITDTIFANAFE